MALLPDYKFQYQLDHIEHVPYTGRKYEAALYEKDGRIARITLNRPEKRNAFNDAMFGDLLAGLHQALDDPEVRIVIIRGAGRNFSAGHELSSPKDEHGRPEETPPIPPEVNPTVRDFYNVERRRCSKYEDIYNYPKITIAQVHGPIIGAGEFIASACDITIAAEDARFGARGFGRITEGVHLWPGSWPSGSQRRRGGTIIDEITGKEAAELGLINKAVPLEELEEEVNKRAHALSYLPPRAVALAKELINGVTDICGLGLGYRSHYESHVCLQFPRFTKGEVSFYKERRDRGLKGFFEERARSATPGVRED